MLKERTIKDRIIESLGDRKPTPWGRSIGLGNGTITRIFKYDEPPSTKNLILISNALDKSIDWLLTGEFRDE